MRPQDTVPKPGFDIPNLTPEQQEMANLPENFWAAFDEYFSGTRADLPRLRARLAKKIGCRVEEMVSGDEGWFITDVGDATATLTYVMESRGEKREVCDLTLRDPELVGLTRQLSSLTDPDKRRDLLDRIRAGEKPVWAFLPPTEEQDEAKSRLEEGQQRRLAMMLEHNELSGLQRKVGLSDDEAAEEAFRDCGMTRPDALMIHALRRRRFAEAGGKQRLVELREKIAADQRETAAVEYELGWPGETPPPREER